MSSPNHPSSDIEDDFSSNIPDYISASPDYFPAAIHSLGFPSHAHNAIIPTQVLIPPQIIVPPSPMLSLMFVPQDFFRPEEILPPKKRGRARSSTSTSALENKEEAVR
ncbi:hypothetical protein Tco_0923870 [Tanacetum coccineum]|uniref:Uncharacterized protein n=1 Tax=Tanacetum coccineum TaxID=301880 RepID=A0ABQ5D5H4_9ASTR